MMEDQKKVGIYRIVVSTDLQMVSVTKPGEILPIPTNVISFNVGDERCPDMQACYDMAVKYAEEQ